jgi:pyridoxamine 5'-phosphate oxidase
MGRQRRAPDPIAEFLEAFERAKIEQPGDPTAMTLATADAQGRPAARMVLLKAVDSRGFVFYTNYESRKAEQLAANPAAALCIYWPALDLQVRVEGSVERTSEAESDTYFATRPHGSQIGAWASQQSRPLSSRAKLLAQVAETEARFLGRSVPRPPFWGGFRVIPRRIEFWHNQLHRLHDRRLFVRREDGWTVQRLYP